MMPRLAHLLDTAAGPSWWLLAVLVAAVLLVGEHAVVKHGGLNRRSAGGLAVAVVVAGSVLIGGQPLVEAGQRTNGLPDLISDPPRPRYLKEIIGADGDPRLVVTFDGYIHNIGDGPLEVVGNPQLEKGMVQRVRIDGEWQEVGFPTVYFENDDGHNHFHLIEAIDYVLWNESVGAEAAIGSKVGFCLVDSEQMEPGADRAYSEESNDFCQQDNPGATSLRMGISAGWRDIYDSTTTLQWVDVSDTPPGRYWIGAITDANDEIIESNEENNALIFATQPAIVPGWVPLDAEVTTDGAPVTIELGAKRFGTVTDVVFTVVEGPASGRIDVPLGAGLLDPVVRYTPDAGFEGSDRIVVAARDLASRYPIEAPTAEILIEVTGPGQGGPEPGDAPTLFPSSTFLETTLGERFSSDIGTSTAGGGAARLYAVGLPSGLAVDGQVITGIATEAGIFDIELIAIDGTGASTVQQIPLIVNSPSGAVLIESPDRSSPLDRSTRLQLGAPKFGARYSASGLPPGLSIIQTGPIITGTPTETGTYEVEVRQAEGDGRVLRSTFTWVIRPAVAIRFPV